MSDIRVRDVIEQRDEKWAAHGQRSTGHLRLVSRERVVLSPRPLDRIELPRRCLRKRTFSTPLAARTAHGFNAVILVLEVAT